MSYLMLADGVDIREFYVAVPTQDGEIIHVREDYFDQFPDDEYEYMMDQLDGVGGVSGLFKSREYRKARREERKANKEASKDSIKQGKLKKQEARQGRRASFFDKLTNTVKSFAPGQGGDGSGAKGLNVDAGINVNNTDEDIPFYQKPEIMIPGIIILGAVGYGIYKATQK